MLRYYLYNRCSRLTIHGCAIPIFILFILIILLNHFYDTPRKKTSEHTIHELLKKLQECKNALAKQRQIHDFTPTVLPNMANKPDVKQQDVKNKTINKNQVNFKLLLPFIEPSPRPQEKSLFVAVMVNTAAKGEKHRTLRNTIRKTWGISRNPVVYGNKIMTWKLFFALGIADNPSDHNANLREAQQYNDTIIGNFTDTYRNLVIKTFMSYVWTITRLSCQYVLKTDDDVYVRVPKLITWLNANGFPKSLYGGTLGAYNTVVRDPKSPWYITKEQFNETMWPPWCHGSYTVISSAIIPKYLNFTYKITPFHTDDAYFGLASRELGIKVVKIPGFTFEHDSPKRTRSKSELSGAIAIGHKLDTSDLMKYHNYYQHNA